VYSQQAVAAAAVALGAPLLRVRPRYTKAVVAVVAVLALLSARLVRAARGLVGRHITAILAPLVLLLQVAQAAWLRTLLVQGVQVVLAGRLVQVVLLEVLLFVVRLLVAGQLVFT
jgi:hypothetical protein